MERGGIGQDATNIFGRRENPGGTYRLEVRAAMPTMILSGTYEIKLTKYSDTSTSRMINSPVPALAPWYVPPGA
jgi:hypothetical protein